jgi:hypothetical protein
VLLGGSVESGDHVSRVLVGRRQVGSREWSSRMFRISTSVPSASAQWVVSDQVCLVLAGGERIDDCQLISTGRGGVETLWIFTDGSDTFVPLADVVDLWEAAPNRSRAAWGLGQLIGIGEWEFPPGKQAA